MFYWRSEGELIKNGLNAYPLNNTESAGGILKLQRLVFRVRYSKAIKEWFCDTYILDKDGCHY